MLMGRRNIPKLYSTPKPNEAGEEAHRIHQPSAWGIEHDRRESSIISSGGGPGAGFCCKSRVGSVKQQ